MLSQFDKGSTVTSSSVHARVGYPWLAAYPAGKGAVTAQTATRAAERSVSGVRVNAIAPSRFPTDLSQGLLGSKWLQDIERQIPLRRTSRPDELGPAVAYFLGDHPSCMTATRISVDGGWQAWWA